MKFTYKISEKQKITPQYSTTKQHPKCHARDRKQNHHRNRAFVLFSILHTQSLGGRWKILLRHKSTHTDFGILKGRKINKGTLFLFLWIIWNKEMFCFLTIQSYSIQPLCCQKVCFNIFRYTCTCICSGHLQQSCLFTTKLHAYFTVIWAAQTVHT